jgi:hypothetical protein
LRFIRGDAYLTLNPELQVTSPQNVVSVDMTRKQIRNGTWKISGSIWDSNWELDNFEQIFGIYEEDTQGTESINRKQTTSAQYGQPPFTFTLAEEITFAMTFKTQDLIISQQSWDRESFYQYNQTGFGPCGTRDGWTVYECGARVRYTLPTQ